MIKSDLSPRERQIMTLVAEGKTNKEMAEALNISYWTVKQHRRQAYWKLDAHNAVEAVMAFIGRGSSGGTQ